MPLKVHTKRTMGKLQYKHVTSASGLSGPACWRSGRHAENTLEGTNKHETRRMAGNVAVATVSIMQHEMCVQQHMTNKGSSQKPERLLIRIVAQQ